MNYGTVIFVLSLLGGLVSGVMILPALWAYYEGTPDAAALLSCALGSLAVCAAVATASRPSRRDAEERNKIGAREAFAIVTFSWVVASAVGALPYVAYGTTATFTDAFFESMSGFSTTGASILTNIEENPHGILLWRALTHWLGGMGIIVLGLTILPFIGGGGMELFKAESPTPLPEKLTPRLQQTALILWGIYVLLTALETAALMMCGTTFYEALTHSFATIATGGFSIYNDSIAHFNSPLIEWVITAFTFLAGINFTLHFLFIRGNFRAYLQDDEFRWYLGFTVIAALAIATAGMIAQMQMTPSTIFRYSVFQTVTLLTTTGFSLTDTTKWPYFVHFLLLIAMVIGGCAGSTGGGMKMLRIMILGRSVKNDLTMSLQPRRVMCVRINGRPQEDRLVVSVLTYFVLYMLLTGVLTLYLCALGIDVTSSFSGVLACVGNIGPGLGQFGPVSNYFDVPATGKWALAFAMLAGRLELYTVFILFLPATWRR